MKSIQTPEKPATAKQFCICGICGGSDLVELIRLPKLPLTDTFCQKRLGGEPADIDQSFLFCPACRHGQVSHAVDAHILYGDRYHFRSSESATSRKGTEFFANFLLSTFPRNNFSSILDVGCNDLHLLKTLKPLSGKRYGIDPLWEGKESELDEDSITVFGKTIEDITGDELAELSADLVVCRHSLEHIRDPLSVLKKLFAESRENCVFLFEVPALEILVGKQRFDHIFHQHLHYFSLASFLHLVESTGGCYVSHTWNYHDWGALLVAFKKGGQSAPLPDSSDITIDLIERSYTFFQRQFQATGELLTHFKDHLMYGYGAAQMLPVIAYHLKNDLSCLKGVLDDDPRKDGLRYWNLPVRIQYAREARDVEDAIVFITAIDNVKPILKRLFKLNPKDILYPLHIF